MKKNNIRRIILFLVLLVIICLLTRFLVYPEFINDTAISGFKLRNQIWNGTIIVKGDVSFFPFSTLTVLPGTKIYFEKITDEISQNKDWAKAADEFIKEANDPTGQTGYEKAHFSIYGKIIAVGTKSSPITFTSAQKKHEYADWDKLVLFSDSKLEYVNISYTHNGITILGDRVIIVNSSVHDSLWSCIDIYSKWNLIEGNDIFHCWHQGIGVKKNSQNKILSNYIHDSMLSVNCELGARPLIKDNLIKAAPLNLNCTGENNTIKYAMPDVPGGTFGGRLIYKPYYLVEE